MLYNYSSKIMSSIEDLNLFFDQSSFENMNLLYTNIRSLRKNVGAFLLDFSQIK